MKISKIQLRKFIREAIADMRDETTEFYRDAEGNRRMVPSAGWVSRRDEEDKDLALYVSEYIAFAPPSDDIEWAIRQVAEDEGVTENDVRRAIKKHGIDTKQFDDVDVPEIHESFILGESNDPVQQILRWAKEGGRVTSGNDVLMWPGIGNRSGLHSYANELAFEKWEEGGEYFTRQIEKLHPGHKIKLKRFKNVTRDRGKWVTDAVVVLTEPPVGAKTGEQPSRDVLETIYNLLSGLYQRDIGASNVSNISLFPDAEENGSPWGGKVWKVTVKGDEYLFKDDPTSTELAEDTYGDGIWETIRIY